MLASTVCKRLFGGELHPPCSVSGNCMATSSPRQQRLSRCSAGSSTSRLRGGSGHRGNQCATDCDVDSDLARAPNLAQAAELQRHRRLIDTKVGAELLDVQDKLMKESCDRRNKVQMTGNFERLSEPNTLAFCMQGQKLD